MDVIDLIIRTGYAGKVSESSLHEVAGRATYYTAEFVEHVAELMPQLLEVLGL